MQNKETKAQTQTQEPFKYVLIYVVNREISTSFYKTFEEAQKELFEVYKRFLEDSEDDPTAEYGTDEDSSVWITSIYDNVDGQIHKIWEN